MARQPAWRRYLRFWGPDPENDFEDELEFHLQTKIEELMGAGMPAAQARREARRRFGPVRPVRNECYQIGKREQAKASRTEYFLGWLRDVKYAARVLGRTKASSAAAILILAVGIGATTSVFTFLDRLLFRPLPVPKPSQLVLISNAGWDGHGGRIANQYFSYEAYQNLRDHAPSFTGVTAESYLTPREHRRGQKIESPAQATAVSGNYFEVLGVAPIMGRGLTLSDDVRSESSHVAVASYRFWSRRYQRAPNALGETVYLKDIPFTIVGVMPEGFFGTHQGNDTDLYIPLASLGDVFSADMLTGISSFGLLGRLGPGVRAAQAQSNLQVVWDQYLTAKGAAGTGPRTQPVGQRIEFAEGSAGYAGTGGEKQRSLVLLTAIVTVLLSMGCANVACLLMARGAARRHEIAIRLSLGAGNLRILRQTLMESCLLALIGGGAGIVVSFWANSLLLTAFQWTKRPIDLTPDWRVLAFGLGLSLATGLLFGLAPAVQFLRAGRVSPNQEETGSARFGSGRALVVVEVALSLILVAGAGVFIHSFQNLRAVPKGFAAEHVSVIELASISEEETLKVPYRETARLVESLEGAPGIEAATMADFVTFNDASVQTILKVAGETTSQSTSIHKLLVDGGYFAALRVPLLAGRTFTARDDERGPRVAILAEGTARRLFPGQNPLGKRIFLGAAAQHPKPGVETEVIGVVKDIKIRSLAEAAPDLVFLPVLQGENNASSVKLQVRSRMGPPEVAALVRSRIRSEHLPVSIEAFGALEDRIDASLQNDRVRMQASSLFGGLALLLIVAGIYGLMAYSVARRTREIGIRMAVGSSSGGIVGLVLKDSSRLVAYGVLVGLPGAVVVMKLIGKLVFGISPVDLASLGAAALILILTGFLASARPAWRAAHLDPVEALRIQ